MPALIALIPSFNDADNSYNIPRAYINALASSSSICIVTPYDTPLSFFKENVNGIVFTGGCDVSPLLWGEEPSFSLGMVAPFRDNFETKLMRLAFNEDIPVLGICRGCQLMAVALGGSLFQDIHTETSSKLKHMQTAPRSYPSHSILLNSHSRLYTILENYYNKVNSFHHQAVDCLPEGFIVSAYAPDGITEAIECPSRRFFMGIQWHPELMACDDKSRSIFSTFINSAIRQKEDQNG